ncbi:unnamed protein product [Phytophthora fragariaefolia]|uniref:Unnamed protein product n=1 Tax=Phytophthora fragariaefolia TaxID=1490495 RepID=A0A9W6XKX4_9STRA|nr:unnamed protein product [Phytophthora fragariaefolia]
MLAIRERLSFLSLCIETWGYYTFLRMLEAEGNGNLMWWGGQAGRTTKEAKAYTCSAARVLVNLYHNDNDMYRRKVKNTTKPFHIDFDGFMTMTDLLVQTPWTPT